MCGKKSRGVKNLLNLTNERKYYLSWFKLTVYVAERYAVIK